MAQVEHFIPDRARRALRRTIRGFVGVTLLATIAGELGRYYWVLDLFVHFKLQYAAVFAICAFAALGLRDYLVGALAMMGALFHSWPVFSFAHRPFQAIAAEQTAFRLVSYNAALWNDHYAEIGAFLESTQADAVILLEYNNRRLDELQRFLPSYRFRSSGSADSRFGAAILSRWPFEHDTSITLAPGGAVAAHTRVRKAGRSVALFGVHLNWPATPGSSRSREAELLALSKILRECTSACVVAGDFNLTQWSAHFRDFQQRTGWNNCGAGQGLVATWPDQIPPLRIQIDQCLTDPRTHATRLATGPGMGSDHLPLIADLAFE